MAEKPTVVEFPDFILFKPICHIELRNFGLELGFLEDFGHPLAVIFGEYLTSPLRGRQAQEVQGHQQSRVERSRWHH